MPSGWQKAYDELKGFISNNTSIEIEANVVCISSDVRPEFYRLFNTVCVRFIKETFPDLLKEGCVMSKKWGEISQKLMEGLKLESIDVDTTIEWFLLDPNDGLTRGLFDSLFDLLKGKKDLSSFEQTAVRVLKDEFALFLREGYQCWSIVALMDLLLMDKIYHLPISDFDMNPSLQPEELCGRRQENVPHAVEINKISFMHNIMYSFLVPKVIGHSARLNNHTAFCRDFNFSEVRWRAKDLSPKQEWLVISEIMQEFGQVDLWPDLAIYTGTHQNELVVAADYFKMARPDIILDFRVDKDWYEKEGLEPIRRHYNVLKPRLGSFVVCREPVPEAALEELVPNPEIHRPKAIGVAIRPTYQPAPDIHLLTVGYDLLNLEPIVDTMLKGITSQGRL